MQFFTPFKQFFQNNYFSKNYLNFLFLFIYFIPTQIPFYDFRFFRALPSSVYKHLIYSANNIIRKNN